MARKKKYQPRPLNDGDRWVDGYYHMKPRQRRADPLAHPVKVDGTARQMNTGTNHTTQWKHISYSTTIELAVEGKLTPAQVLSALDYNGRYIKEWFGDFSEALMEAAKAGEIDDPMSVLIKYKQLITTGTV